MRVPPLRRLIEEQARLRLAELQADRQLAGARRQIDELKAHIAELSTTAPVDADVANPRPSLGYLFIVTYGRSGSTLLQGMLNTIPGYLIRGENRAVTYRLYQFHSAVEAARDEFGRSRSLNPQDSWFGIDEYASAAALARLRALILDALLRPTADTKVVGFKEIRWWQKDWAAYLDFLRALFPGARFVINTRDHAAVARSQWWGKWPEEDVLAELAGYETQLTSMAERLGPAAYRVHYDDYVNDPAALTGLFDWLGEPLDRATIDGVLQVRHSF